MSYKDKLQELHNEVVAKLKSITDRPKGWLPHLVFIEDVCDVDGCPVYYQYRLVDFTLDGECQLLNVITGEIEDDYCLRSIETTWLVTVLDRYYELKNKE